MLENVKKGNIHNVSMYQIVIGDIVEMTYEYGGVGVPGVTPFLKWPGGKRWLFSQYGQKFPRSYNHFYEPFLGGAAAFFYLSPTHAILSDINSELINLYRIMRDNSEELAQEMQNHQKLHCEKYYYFIRSKHFEDPIQAASRLLYLNRTCYNGMYRVNKAGQYNVPIGTKQNCIFDMEKFPAYSRCLQNADIISCDFADAINNASTNDLVFADPPYTISHNQNSFIKYNEKLFTWKDQERLLNLLCVARERGVIIIATNANFGALKKMYIDNGFYVDIVERFSVMSGKTEKRQKQGELLISSIPLN